jgi:hypothetical protein
MERKSNIFWGVVLVAVGILFLANSLDWFEFNWSFVQVAKFWPVLLILAGVSAFFNDKKSIFNTTSALLIAFSIPLAIFSIVYKGAKDWKNDIKEEFRGNIDFDDNDEPFDPADTVANKNTQNFVVDNANVNEVELNLRGGAAQFTLEKTDAKLFEAEAAVRKGRYSLTEDTQDGKKVIDFEMKKAKWGKGDWDGDNNRNKVKLKMNQNPIWDVDVKFGAGDIDFDFSEYKIKRLDIETGAAEVDVKLGDKVEEVDVEVSSGAAAVKLQVQKGVGCRIKLDGILNDKNFDGFTKVDNDTWETEGYSKSTKKINIDIESAIAELKVSRY